MPKIEYQQVTFRDKRLGMIETANAIIAEYQADDYSLTLRQLYYQFVARDLFPEDRRWKWTGRKWVKDANGTKNADPNYKWLGSIVNDGRLAGLIDWEAITDRTRESRGNDHFEDPQEILRVAADTYRIDTRADQDCYLEVWIEKDALVGVLERVCTEMDISYFSCRGYVSQSAMWEAGQRIIAKEDEGHSAVILHMGDHDPSGINMSHDIQKRLDLFGCRVEVNRIALNMDQIEELKPPPDPAKPTDSRYKLYVEKYGTACWELDALDPKTLTALVATVAEAYTDTGKRDKLIARQEEERLRLRYVARNWQKLDL